MLWRGPRQEIQCRLSSPLAAPLSADRSATELILTRLASELIAILASELLHLSLHAKESRLFLSTTCDWRCSGSQLQLQHHLHLHQVVLVPHPQDHQVVTVLYQAVCLDTIVQVDIQTPDSSLPAQPSHSWPSVHRQVGQKISLARF